MGREMLAMGLGAMIALSGLPGMDHTATAQTAATKTTSTDRGEQAKPIDIKHWKSVLRRSTNDPAQVHMVAEAHTQLGEAYRAKNNLRQAKKHFTKAVALASDKAVSRFQLANALFGLAECCYDSFLPMKLKVTSNIKTMRNSLTSLVEKMTQCERDYDGVFEAKYSVAIFQAVIRQGQLYENLAKKLAYAPIPNGLPFHAEKAYRDQTAQITAPVHQKMLILYKNALGNFVKQGLNAHDPTHRGWHPAHARWVEIALRHFPNDRARFFPESETSGTAATPPTKTPPAVTVPKPSGDKPNKP